MKRFLLPRLSCRWLAGVVPVYWLAVIAGCTLLSGCGGPGSDVEERITQLQKELDRVQGELQSANKALAEARAQSAPASTSSGSSQNSSGLPSKDALEESYMASAKSLRKEIESRLDGFSIESCTLHTVQMPEELHPFTSTISLSLRADEGTAYQVELPVKANVRGEWSFPDVAQVVAQVENAKNAPPTSAAHAAPSENASAAGASAPVMAVDGTIMIQWPDSPGASGSGVRQSAQPTAGRARQSSPSEPWTSSHTSTTAAPQPTPGQPSGSETPAPVMPVSRDVLIKF